MGKQSIEIIKDLFVSILIVTCMSLILSIIFYDKISLSKVVPESEEYVLSDKMQKSLEESELEDAQEVIVNYYIDASDLKKYEKTNEYVKGKSNPFAEVSELDTENDAANGESNESSNTIDNSGNGGFYEDDGTK